MIRTGDWGRCTAAGRKKYLDYLVWLAEDEPARKAQNFSEMSKGWIIGTVGFAMDMAREHAEAAGHGRRLASDMRIAQEAVWAEELARLLSKLGRPVGDLKKEGKSVPWKLALAAALKSRTTATNRWLGANMYLGNLHEVSRKVAEWRRRPDSAFTKKLT